MAAVIGNREISLGVMGGTLITAACYSGGNVFGCSPYDAATTRYLKATYPSYWAAIRDYGFANPQLVPWINEDNDLIVSLVSVGKRRSLIPQGNCAIDTGILVNGRDEIYLDMTSIDNASNYTLFGASNGNAFNNGEVALFWNAAKWDGVVPTSNTSSSAGAFGTYVKNTHYEIFYSKEKLVCGTDERDWSSLFYQDYQGIRSMYLFCTNRSNSKWYGVFKAHRFTIQNKWDGVPFMRTNGECGMLDIVNATFHPNANTSGAFTIEITDR